MARLIKDKYEEWKAECNERFNRLKSNEEELNRIFIDIYGLQDELTPDVADKDVTVYRVIDKPDEEERKLSYVLSMRDMIVSLISYAVGCMFGRYSVAVEGLRYAGGNFSDYFMTPMSSRQLSTGGSGRKVHFQRGEGTGRMWFVKADDGRWVPNMLEVDGDNILPICDDDYFADDIVERFVDFVERVYGKETLEENLRFISDALEGKGSSREVIRSYFLNDFYADHVRTYKKRPIYWLFSSGKKNGFKALLYMHRYQPDLLARMRTDYVHEQQERYRTQLQMLETNLTTASKADQAKIKKQIIKIKDQADELLKYEEKIHHLADQMIEIDLDDGVKVNYAKFGDVLEKIK